MSLPIATSPGRSGFGPQLALSYDSGAGNGPFGFGWHLAIPTVTRSTDKAIPRYLDAAESDVYVLSGSEDLVPALVHDPADEWAREGQMRTVDGVAYRIERYRPRVEGMFARIERWTRLPDGDIQWRSISRDNVTSWYGKTAESRIVDPADPRRLFSWLLCETYDDKGNAAVYEYAPEDSTGVDLGVAHEANRTLQSRSANRYLKRIKYGNTVSRLVQPDLAAMGWLFEIVFDYAGDGTDLSPGQHVATADPDADEFVFASATLADAVEWDARPDAFSSYRAGFEVRTYRLCRRVLMFHHFPDELGIDDYLVRSTNFQYRQTPVATFLTAVDQSGYVLRPEFAPAIRYLKRSMPPVEFTYSEVAIDPTVLTLDPESLGGLPEGLAGAYQWVDLEGDGVGGVLTEQGENWFYKRNTSQLFVERRDGVDRAAAHLGPVEAVGERPALTLAAGAQFMDLAGDGRPDLVMLAGPAPGLYEREDGGGWTPYRTFPSRPAFDPADPNLRFLDLDGDGHADALMTRDEAMTWHTSLAENGFGPERRVPMAIDEEHGPRLVFADGTDSIHLADMTGDGSTDLVRIENGGVSYWPNLGEGRFGKRVAMDRAPVFDAADAFDAKRIRLIDIDGSGTTDIAYVGSAGVVLHFNRAGNSWGEPVQLDTFPRIDEVTSVGAFDLLGNGTGCLVWSSPLPGSSGRGLRYIDLMGGQKPHLLLKVENNLGQETHVRYAPSTRFYLRDRQAGRPWITRLPFPVQVVERVDTYDRVSRNRFVTRYAYHHGFFDGVEREFRGFGMVEQWDTEEFAALSGSDEFPDAVNVDEASHVPPVLTKTWFHTGAFVEGGRISLLYEDDYYREPGLTDDEFQATLLPDTELPPGLTTQEVREACRALKASMLRQEVYGLDGSAAVPHPYTVAEHTLSVRRVQPRSGRHDGVYLTSPREALTYHYERSPGDARVEHAITLELSAYGDVLKEASIAYGRSVPDGSLPLAVDRDRQAVTYVRYSEFRETEPIDGPTFPDAHRAPLRCDARSFELTGYPPTGGGGRYTLGDLVVTGSNGTMLRFDTELEYEELPTSGRQRRLFEHLRILYRSDDLASLLPLGNIESMAIAGESYMLAFTSGLLAHVYERDGIALLDDPDATLAGVGPAGGGYVRSAALKTAGLFPLADHDDRWWAPSGRSFLSPDRNDTPAQELTFARGHFFHQWRTRDPFDSNSFPTEYVTTYDPYDLMAFEIRDPVGNLVTAGQRQAGMVSPSPPGIDYRTLQPILVMDANGNRTAVAFDAYGLIAGTAFQGKPGEAIGDPFDNFVADLPAGMIVDALADPPTGLPAVLGRATTRLVYDVFAYRRTRSDPRPQPSVVQTLHRETHQSDLAAGEVSRIRISRAFADGFGRTIQEKVPAEPGEAMPGGPQVNPRWVGSGWKVFDNKGNPIREFEPFFSASSGFESNAARGVTSIVFRDPLERIVATVHPDHTYEKVVFGAWRTFAWDVNDTILLDPRTDPDVASVVARSLPGLSPGTAPGAWPTWHATRVTGALGPTEQAAATNAAAHAGTPTRTDLDALGRVFLAQADSGPDPAGPAGHRLIATRVDHDIEGNQRTQRDGVDEGGDPAGRIVAAYDYDLMGNRVRQNSIDAGTRWLLPDAAASVFLAWDSRGHRIATDYDQLRRPIRTRVAGIEPTSPATERVFERFVYGEQHPQPETSNLRGRLFVHLDQAGAEATEAFDFKGNPTRTSRRLVLGTLYRAPIDWAVADSALAQGTTDAPAVTAALAAIVEDDAYVGEQRYDAENRAVLIVSPHTPSMSPSTIRLTFSEAGLLDRLDANMRGRTSSGELVWSAFVTDIAYDPKGQRTRIAYANGAVTTTDYDPATFRPVHIETRRSRQDFPQDCPQPPAAGWLGCDVQNVRLTYDPVGNVAHIQDDAQQAIYFRNKRVEPNAAYVYDAIYRMVEATGREHLGQAGGSPAPHTADDSARVGIAWGANDGLAMGRYVEHYVYDAASNVLEVRHRGSDPANLGWTRGFVYDQPSAIEDGSDGTIQKSGNRLGRSRLGTTGPIEPYDYDPHANPRRLPHLGGPPGTPNLIWDYQDRLTRVDTGGGGVVHYAYDASGQRVRKVWEKSVGLVEERIYLAGFEIFRRRQGGARLERETLHVMDSDRRIALVETRTVDSAGADAGPSELTRYQIANHLGSSTTELDAAADVISYEEFSPYGNTTYQAVRSQVETPKRYRYAAKEREEESGLIYFGARYMAPWLCRWISPDPIGTADGPNLYAYARCNPVRNVDPDGLFTKKKYDDWLDTQIKAGVADLAKRESGLKGTIDQRDKATRRLGDIGTQKSSLEKQRADVAAKRKPLESKPTKLSKTEAAELKALKAQNTKLVAEIRKLDTEAAALNSSVIRLKEKITSQQGALTTATDKLKATKDLKARFDAAYKAATKTQAADVELLTDVVMNEARNESPLAKKAIAYAYTNDKVHHMKGGHPVQPPTKGSGTISHYFQGVTESRFDGATNKPQYIDQVIESLGASSARVGDTSGAGDPTGGSTHWVSPDQLKTKFPPDGLPNWARAMTQTTVTGIPGGTFTFLKEKPKKTP